MLQFLTQSGRKTAWLFLCGLCLSSWTQAQEIRQAAAEAGRPAPLETQVGLSPELIEILKTWEKQSGSVNRSKGEFSRVEYDRIMQTARCATGRYWYEGPDKGRMDFTPNEAAEGKKTKKREIEFSCQPDQAKTWICNGKEILDIDIAKKEYNKIEIPLQFQGQNIADGPLPFLFGMNAQKMQQRYMLELGSLHDPKKIIHIIAYPKMPAEQREYRVAEVLLDPNTFLPQAVQLMDTTGNKETVYVFSKHDNVVGPWLPTAPWKPTMFGFKEIMNQRADPPAEREVKGGNNQGIMLR
ncbi:TIGR03009 domain-containing protein [Planctomicrobium sp. SH661]|uniref:TIGR03009 domain-containing protein n=1 Tax=Planctomicrobium sp. SH661 TaxID=3448124 RepID=UPI003F5CB298